MNQTEKICVIRSGVEYVNWNQVRVALTWYRLAKLLNIINFAEGNVPSDSQALDRGTFFSTCSAQRLCAYGIKTQDLGTQLDRISRIRFCAPITRLVLCRSRSTPILKTEEIAMFQNSVRLFCITRYSLWCWNNEIISTFFRTQPEDLANDDKDGHCTFSDYAMQYLGWKMGAEKALHQGRLWQFL